MPGTLQSLAHEGPHLVQDALVVADAVGGRHQTGGVDEPQRDAVVIALHHGHLPRARPGRADRRRLGQQPKLCYIRLYKGPAFNSGIRGGQRFSR